MAIDFPNSPALNDYFESSGKAWTFNGTSWDIVQTPANLSIANGSITAPKLASGVAVANIGYTPANVASPTFTGAVVLPSTTSIGDISSTELSYVDGVTSAIQTQLNAKAPSASPTFTGTVTVSNDLTVTGNLTVNGTNTILNTETLSIEDNIIVLNSNVSASPILNAGIEVERGTSSNVLIRWNETNGQWEFTNDGTTYGDIAALGTIELGTDTTGNFVSDITQGTGVTVTHTPGEGSSPTVAIGQAVGTSASVTFANVTANLIGNVTGNASTVTNGIYTSSSINALADVDTVSASPTSGQFLKWNGTNWVPDSVPTINALDDIGNVSASAPSSGDFLKWDGSAWVNAVIPSSGATVSETPPSSPTTGQVWYESDTGKTFVYYDSFWIEIVGSTGAQGPTGAEGGTTTLTTKGDLLTRSASAVSRLPVGATNGHVLTVDSAETSGMKWAAVAAGMTELDAQTFTSSTTYTVVAGAKVIVVECVSSGGGGGGGARNTSTSQACGGGGGGGGAWERVVLAASEVGATATVTIGAGGAGGAGGTNSSSATDGTVGGNSRFATLYFSGGRNGTSGSTSSSGSGGAGYTGGLNMTTAFGVGANGSVGNGAGVSGRKSFRGGAGGGGGNGRITVDRTGGNGGSYETEPQLTTTTTYVASTGDGAAGGVGGGVGGAGAAGASFGIGGGGGGSSNTDTGGAGGAGGTGAGGGGGGGANGGNNGGAGGAGGNAQIKIWVFG